MAKTLVDIDDKLLDDAAAVLGTKTKKDTVTAALDQAVRNKRKQELINQFVEGDGYPDLGNPEIMKGAWR